MRITNGMMSKNLLNNLQLNMKRMSRLNQQASSGKLFDNPSDAPVAMAKSLKLYTDVSKVHQYERNLRDAQSWLHSTEGALHEMGEIFQRTRELAVDMANGTKTESDTQKAAAEIAQLKDQMIKLANTRHAGRSIFTGYQTNKDLLNSDGTYKIDLNKKLDSSGNKVNEVSVYNVGVAENLELNILGSKIFGVKNDTELEFKNIDGKNTLTIDLGDANAALGDLEVEVVRGDADGASWSGNKLTITLNTAATIEASDIKDLIEDATGAPSGFNKTIVGVTIDGPIGKLKDTPPLLLVNTATVDGKTGVAAFSEIDGKDDLTITLGVNGVDIQIVEGNTDSAEWDISGNLKITLSSGNKTAKEIEELIKKADLTNVPPSYDPDSISVTTENRLNGEKIKNSILSTRRTNTSDIKEGQKSHLIDVFDQLIAAMGKESGGLAASFNQEEISNLIGEVDVLMENALTLRAEVGAKTNRLEMTSKRLSSEELNFTTVLSENEDVDEAEIIMKFKMAEAVYNASLAMGGKTIQSTLVDFLR